MTDGSSLSVGIMCVTENILQFPSVNCVSWLVTFGPPFIFIFNILYSVFLRFRLPYSCLEVPLGVGSWYVTSVKSS